MSDSLQRNFESPVQNSVEKVASVQHATSPPCSQATMSTPPDNHSTHTTTSNDEFDFFSNVEYKKCYHKVHKSLVKVEKCSSRIWFLRNCLRLDILPPTLDLKACNNVRFSSQASETFRNNIKKSSVENLKLAITEEGLHLEKCKKELKLVTNKIHELIKEAHLHSFVESRILKDRLQNKKQLNNTHQNKLIFLLKKNEKPIPEYLKGKNQENRGTNSKKNRKFIKRTKYRRNIKRLNKKNSNLATNYSDIEISSDMKSLLDKGLSFAIMPQKINTTDIHAGFENLGRNMKWTEVLTKTDVQDNDSAIEEPSKPRGPWNKTKTSLPKNAPSEELNTFLNGSKACVLGSDLNKVRSNLPENEKRAMHELIELQKSRQITIKPNDKTGGVSIMNTDDYVKSMENLLNSKFIDEDGNEHPYFQKLDAYQADQMQFNDLEKLKKEVSNAKDQGWIDKDIANWLVPDEPAPGRLYGLVKDHVSSEKWPENSKIPPLRPVESASGTTFENASHFVDLHSNDLVKSLPSYWEDTSHMLRDFEKQNEKGPLPDGAIPVTIDVTSLYTNIPLKQGIDIFAAFLDTREDKSVPTSFLITLLTLVLTCNIFVFDSKYYLQRIGTAMGTRVAPTFACLFMGAIEFMMLKAWKGLKPFMYRRYIDDGFFYWTGSENELLDFVSHLNRFHPFLKFKVSYNFVTRSVEFLDTVITVNDKNFIETSLYTKPGKKCSYLKTSSCHPKHNTENIPYSLALRLKRICSDPLDFLEQLDKLKDKLKSRGYKDNYISRAFERVKPISRTVALLKVEKKTVKRPILSLQYDPRLPNISNILYRFWKVMIQNPNLKKIFPEPPMICWRRPKNLREYLIRAKLPKENPDRKSRRSKIGFKHCERNCNMCKFSPRFTDHITSSVTKERVPIVSNLNCLSKNVIYCITCTKQSGSCKDSPQYIGQTGRRICERFSEHKNSIKKNSQKAVGEHFFLPGHKQCDLQIVPFEEIRSKNPFVRLSREKYYIHRLNPKINVRV